MRRGAIAITLGAALALVPACDGPDPAPAPEPALSVSARSGPAEVRVTLDRETMRTVDRLRVTIQASADRGVRLGVPEFDPAAAGWTLVSRVDEPLGVGDDGGVTRRAEVVLEPFLDGDYRVPAVTAPWVDPAGAEGVVSTEPLAVTVTSVLAEGDAGTLAEPGGMVEPPPPEASRVPAAALAAAGAALVAAGAVLGWRLLAPRAPMPEPTALDRLRDEARAGTPDPDRACALVATALREARLRADGARALLDEAERVRYGRAPVTPERARAMVTEALAMLEPRAPGGMA